MIPPSFNLTDQQKSEIHRLRAANVRDDLMDYLKDVLEAWYATVEDDVPFTWDDDNDIYRVADDWTDYVMSAQYNPNNPEDPNQEVINRTMNALGPGTSSGYQAGWFGNVGGRRRKARKTRKSRKSRKVRKSRKTRRR